MYYRRGKDKLTKIFDKQRSLMKKYEIIESDNGLLQTNKVPVAIDTREGQARLKDFCWRITEEMAEALHALENETHEAFMEEIADVLHFLTEFSILSNLEPWTLAVDERKSAETDTLDILFEDHIDYYHRKELLHKLALDFIKDLGMTANCLKNKPWKRSFKDTDLDKYFVYLEWTWRSFIKFAAAAGFDSRLLHEAYFNKNAINQHRQATGY